MIKDETDYYSIDYNELYDEFSIISLMDIQILFILTFYV